MTTGIRLKSGSTNIYPLCYFPVGAIIMLNSDVSPAAVYGGTWEQIEDRFLIGASDNYTVGSMGGDATHTLTVEEIPDHTHTVATGWGASTSGARMNSKRGSSGTGYTYNTLYTGGGQAHENMPPYLAVHTWKRIA